MGAQARLPGALTPDHPNPPGRGRALDRETLAEGRGVGGGTAPRPSLTWKGAGAAGLPAAGTAATLKAIDQRSPSPRNGATEWGCQAGNT